MGENHVVAELDLDPPPDLMVMAAKGETSAVALVLPGGSGDEAGPGDRYRPSVLRMLPFAWSLQRAGHRRGLAVALLRYRVAGWKSGGPGAVEDTRWALAQLQERFGPVPVVLVGHSMGGRTALAAAGEKTVVGVVALAPWIGTDLDVGDLRGRDVVLAHGDGDRITDPRATRAFAKRAQAAGIEVEFVQVPGDGHAMLKAFGTWQRLVRSRVMAMLEPALR
jgi:acetyl esterase/lipase